MGVIIWKTKPTKMKGIIILLACVYMIVDCYPLADGGVGLSHGSSRPAKGHHSTHSVLAKPKAQPGAALHASHGISSGYGYSGSQNSGYGYSGGLSSGNGYSGGQSSGGYGYDEYEKPDPFQFEYGVHDDHYYTDFSEHRSGDEAGNIYGYYEVALPDGRIHHVDYKADGHYGGTVMEVKYTGEARHPESYGGYQDSGYGYHTEHGAVAKPHVF